MRVDRRQEAIHWRCSERSFYDREGEDDVPDEGVGRKHYAELEGSKRLVRSSMNGSYEGDVTGESTTEFLIAYSSDDLATYIGIERIGARSGGSGNFVIQVTGTFAEGVANILRR